MDLRKLDEILEQALNEELPANLDDIILDELKDWEAYIIDELSASDLSEIINKFAEDNGYLIYDEAIVLNVKGRPRITNPELLDKDLPFMEAIELFIETLSDEIGTTENDFVIKGRSGGYWGLDNVLSYKSCKITEHGYELMKQEALQILNDPDLVYGERLAEAGDDALELQGIAYDCIYSNKNALAGKLQEAEDTIELKDTIMEEMKKLSDAIDEKEKEMNTEEFWKEEE